MGKNSKWYDKLFEGENGERPIDKILSERLLLVTFGIMIFVCILIKCTITGECASNTTVLPYIVQTNPSYVSQEQLAEFQDIANHFNVDFDVANSNVIGFKTFEGTWWDYSTYIDTPCYTFYFLDYTTCETTWKSGQNFGNFKLYDPDYYVDVAMPVIKTVRFHARGQVMGAYKGYICDYSFQSAGGYVIQNKRMFGTAVPVSIDNVKYQDSALPQYPVFVTTKIDTMVIGNGGSEKGVLVSNGRLVNPGEPEDPGYDDDDDIEDNPEKPDIDDYIPSGPTPPTIDRTSVESLLESIFDYLAYYKNYIGSLFECCQLSFDPHISMCLQDN